MIITALARLIPAIVLLAAVPTWAAQPGGPKTSGDEQELVFLTWSEYLDPEVVAAFEQKFNAKIKFVSFDTDDTRDDMLVETDGRGKVPAAGVFREPGHLPQQGGARA